MWRPRLARVVLTPPVGVGSMPANRLEFIVSSRYHITRDLFPGYAISTESNLLPPDADSTAVEQYLIDRGRQHRYHHSEQARNNACEQGRRRKEKRQRKARKAAARATAG